MGAWLVLCAGWFAVYAATASGGIQWQDSGQHILRITTGELLNPLGLALSHPLHFWVGRLAVWPELVEPSVAITWISAAAAGVTVANVYGCVLAWTDRQAAAWFAALSLAVAATFWQFATVAESYTLCTALLAGEWWCLVGFARTADRRWLFGMALLNGLGIANHLLAALTTPVLAGVVVSAVRRSRATGRDALVAAGLWMLGTLPYTGLIASQLATSGNPAAVIESALFGESFRSNVLNTAVSLRLLLVDIAFPLYNFPNLLIPAALYGLVAWRRAGRPRPGRALQAAVILHGLFAFRYNVLDQHTFFLPLYVLLAIGGGVGAAAVLARGTPQVRRRWALVAAGLIAATPGLYVTVAWAGRGVGVLDEVIHNKPYRDDYVYLLIPWSIADRSADRMSSEAVALAGTTGLVVIEDRMAEYAVRYKALRAGLDASRMVVSASDPRISAAARNGRDVVLVPRDVNRPQAAAPIGCWERHGDLYVLSRCRRER